MIYWKQRSDSALGVIHSTKIPTGPTGKRGPPQKVDPFFRNFSGWTEPIHWVLDRNFRKVWLNGSCPLTPSLTFRLWSSKTRLSEAEEPNQYQSVGTCIVIGLSFRFCFRLPQSGFQGAFHSTKNSGNFGWYIKWNGPFRFGPTGIFGTSFEGGPLWAVWSFQSVGPKCPFPFAKIVVPSTALFYPAYKTK